MSTVLVRYRIARTGQPVPSDGSAPPDYVRPRDSITTRADDQGEGAVYLNIAPRIPEGARS